MAMLARNGARPLPVRARSTFPLTWRTASTPPSDNAQNLSGYNPDVEAAPDGVIVRVIEYRLEGVEGAEPLYRLVTTLLDHEMAPATELAAHYHERWEIETAFDELKTHLRGARAVLRSKTPDLVRQEFYGLLMAHFAVRGLMHEAALNADEDPDRLSFLHSVRVVRRKMAALGAIPPSGPHPVP